MISFGCVCHLFKGLAGEFFRSLDAVFEALSVSMKSHTFWVWPALILGFYVCVLREFEIHVKLGDFLGFFKIFDIGSFWVIN